MTSGDSKRKFKRYYLKTSLVIEDSREVSLESINISQGGLFFKSSELMEINRKLNLTFTLPGNGKTIEANCKVVHHLETIPTRQYFVGVIFNKLNCTSLDDFGSYLTEYFDH